MTSKGLDIITRMSLNWSLSKGEPQGTDHEEAQKRQQYVPVSNFNLSPDLLPSMLKPRL